MKIGMCQTNTQDNKQANLAQASELIDRAAGLGAHLIMLPEVFNFIGDDKDKIANAEAMDGPTMDMIRNKALEHKVYMHSGSFFEKDGDRIHNTTAVFDPNGGLIAKYRKLHCFDVEIPGGTVYKESDVVTTGDEVVTFNAEGITFGLSICYDLRFPELFRRLMKKGVQVILLPAAFTLQTGRDHWELLLRARAVENLCWLASCGQYGSTNSGSIFFGRSMLVNPWGIVTAQAGDGVGVITGDVDLDLMAQTRTVFPSLQHTRDELFSL